MLPECLEIIGEPLPSTMLNPNNLQSCNLQPDGQSSISMFKLIPVSSCDSFMLSDEPSEKQVIVCQKNIRAFLTRIKVKMAAKKSVRRKRIIQELIDTEETYIHDLGLIISDFKMKMISNRILTESQCTKLFANVDEIRKLHQDFFATLYNHFLEYYEHRIIFADILKSILFFQIYIDYLNNFPNALKLLQELQQKKPVFSKFLKDLQRSEKYRNLKIEDYMIKPIQRLPKYVLLLKEIVKSTEKDHPDYFNIAKALSTFEKVNSTNNDKLKQYSDNYRIAELSAKFELPDNIIVPGVEYIGEESVQILGAGYSHTYSNCTLYLLSNAAIISRTYGLIAHINNARNTRISYEGKHIQECRGSRFSPDIKQKLEIVVPIKQGTSLSFNEDFCYYRHSFTIQCIDGQSCTFVCMNQSELKYLSNLLNSQIIRANNQAIAKLKTMFATDNANQDYIKHLSLLELVPEVNVLGTNQRNDKMLKYTVYIVEIKIKMIRQKIFVRFSELLELEKFIVIEYGKQFVLKQGLIGSSWLNNHQQKTIEERKMNVQRFLKELLSKPSIIEGGWKVLIRLGLPADFYELPTKLTNIQSEILRKSSVMVKTVNFRSSIRKKRSSIIDHSITNHSQKIQRVNSYRLSVFQQQKIEQQQQELSELEQEIDEMNKNSRYEHMDNFDKSIGFSEKKSKISSHHKSSQILGSKKLTIQEILKANQIDLGHYTRLNSESTDFQEFNNKDSLLEKMINLTILVPSIADSFVTKKDRRVGQFYQINVGFKTLLFEMKKYQRIQNVTPIVAKKIGLKYYKDFRLFVEKQYTQRVLDDDQLVYKVAQEVERSNSQIVFRKMIFIDIETEEKQLLIDRKRLRITASQVVNEIKKGKYRLSYENFLKFSVLTAIIYNEHEYQNGVRSNKQFLKSKQSKQKNSKEFTNNDEDYLKELAIEAKKVILPKYASFSQSEDIWVKDFLTVYKIIFRKLSKISEKNLQEFLRDKKQANKSAFRVDSQFDVEKQLIESFSQNEEFRQMVSSPIGTKIKYLALLSIVKEIQKIEPQIYGCISFSVQISEEFKKNLTQILTEKKSITEEEQQVLKKLKADENRNYWLQIKYNKIMLFSTNYSYKLIEIDYFNLSKIETYSSSIILQLKSMEIEYIKLKTTYSYFIRENLIYYRNFKYMIRRINNDADLQDSIIMATREELVSVNSGEVQEFMVE